MSRHVERVKRRPVEDHAGVSLDATPVVVDGKNCERITVTFSRDGLQNV
jgi:hypothetical protein